MKYMSNGADSGKPMGTEAAIGLLLGIVAPVRRRETIGLEEADGRVTAGAVVAPIDYPHYDQCIVDGYAVRAEDTAGAGSKAVALPLSGSAAVDPGTCLPVHTGSALPEGADAVVMLEDARESPGGITIEKAAEKGGWVWPAGAGIRGGSVVYEAGMRLMPTDVALLGKLGVGRVEVYEKPRVFVVPTGDEVVERGGMLGPGVVYESNGLMCSMLIKRYGGVPFLSPIVPDEPGRLAESLALGAEFDLVVTIGGSSGGKRDLMARAVSAAGGVMAHGIAFHPGNHSGVGYVEHSGKKTPVAFLPGYAESCAVAMFTLVRPAVQKLCGIPPRPDAKSRLPLGKGVIKPSFIRKVVKVRMLDGKAVPVRLIGEPPAPGEYAYVVVPENVEGPSEGDEVDCVYIE